MKGWPFLDNPLKTKARYHRIEMEFNDKQKKVIALMEQGKSIMLVGYGGTGKTEALKQFIHGSKKCISVTALTAAAAQLLNGVTIHRATKTGSKSYRMHLPEFGELGKNLQDKFINELRKYEALIIDEVSMMADSSYYQLNIFFQNVFKNYNKPFGGLQVIILGDACQLPPIPSYAGGGYRRWQKRISHDSILCRPIQFHGEIIVLNKFVRQQGDSVLQNVVMAVLDPRENIRRKAIRLVNVRCCIAPFPTDESVVGCSIETGAVIISPMNKVCKHYIELENCIARRMHKQFFGIPKAEKIHERFTVKQLKYWGGWNGVETEELHVLKDHFIEDRVEIYMGQLVRITQNHETTNGTQMMNGNVARVIGFDKERKIVIVEPVNQKGTAVEIGMIDCLSPYEDEGGKLGFKHMPIVPAGTTTVHKVQGQTVVGGIIFDSAGIEVFGPNVARMLGVAFGRVKSLSKLRLKAPIDEKLVCNREVQSSLDDMWGLDYMKDYPRVDEAELDKMLAEARPPTVAEVMASVIH